MFAVMVPTSHGRVVQERDNTYSDWLGSEARNRHQYFRIAQRTYDYADSTARMGLVVIPHRG